MYPTTWVLSDKTLKQPNNPQKSNHLEHTIDSTDRIKNALKTNMTNSEINKDNHKRQKKLKNTKRPRGYRGSPQKRLHPH